MHSPVKCSHGTSLHSKLLFRFSVFIHHQQTLASSSQRVFAMSDEMIYSFNLFERNHKKDSNLLVISLSEVNNLILYFDLLSPKISLIKSEALKTAGPEIHQCVNRIGHDSS
jgi:hypothetical protein